MKTDTTKERDGYSIGVSQDKGQHVEKGVVLLPSARLTLAVLLLFATWTCMFQRLTVNFGLVCMVKRNTIGGSINNLNISVEDDCPVLVRNANESAQFEDGEFEWSRNVQGQVLGAFYYGLVLTSMGGGLVTDRYGPRTTLIASVSTISSLSVLTPVAAWFGPYYLIVLRFFQGVANAATMPAISCICSRWFPDVERGFLLGIVYSGFNIATAVIYPISAFFCKTTGWPVLFYWAGGCGLLLCVFTRWLVTDWPEKNQRISLQELEFVRSRRAVHYNPDQTVGSNRPDVPWKQILTSGPVWALSVSNFACFWIFIALGMYLPTYLREVLHQDISKNGLLSAIPFVVTLILHFVMAVLFDYLRKKEHCSVTILRKIFNTVGTFTAALSTLGIAFLSCGNTWGAVFLLTCGQVFVEVAIMGGYTFSIFELAPRFASTLTAVMNTVGLGVGIIGPFVVSQLTSDGTGEQWLNVFYISAGISFIGGLFYLIFGSSELQTWAKVK